MVELSIKEERWSYWNDNAQFFVGKTVVSVRYLTKEELDEIGFDWWENTTPMFLFDDGSWLIAMSDDEGNGAGSVLGWNASTNKQQDLPVLDV